MIDRQAIVTEALSWIFPQRTPYHHEGNVKGFGVDCAMYPICVYQNLGLIDPDYDPRPYPVEWHLHRNEELYLKGLSLFCHRTKRPGPGDIAMFKYGRTVSHGSILTDTSTDDWEFAHSYLTTGCILTRLSETDYKSRLHSVWSIYP